VLLLVPVMLFMLGLPNKPPEAQALAVTVQVDTSQDAAGYAGMVAVGHSPVALMGFAGSLHQEGPVGDVTPVDFKTLEAAVQTADRRAFWKDKTVELRGQYAPDPRNDHNFSLVRFRIGCCAADAIELRQPILCKEPVKNVAKNSWLKVTGKLKVIDRNGTFVTAIVVPSRARIEACPPDLNPWVQ
jgi:hypothetical protein